MIRQSMAAGRSVVSFDLSLDVVHHGHCGDENERRNHLVRVETRAKKAPGNANCG